MPTIQRLLTDATGQSLVTAINNIVAAVKPNATEIQMSSSDTTTVATAITNINDKMGTVPSGQTIEGQITTLNSKLTSTADTIDSFISVFQSDTAVHNVRIASGTLPRTLYGTGSSGACVGFRTGDYIIYSAFDSDGLFVTGWVTISQRTATFSRPIKSIIYTGELSITSADDGLFYTEISKNTLGIPNATLLSAQFVSSFSSSETLGISSNASKLFITARTSRTVTRTILIFYLE